MSEFGPEGYDPAEEQKKEEVVNTSTDHVRRIHRLLRHVRRPKSEGEDPRDQPVVTMLLSHVAESGGKDFEQFQDIATCRRWADKNPQLSQDQEYNLQQRINAEISNEQIHTLATEQMPQLLNAVLQYKLPLKDYQTVMVLAETAAQKANQDGLRLMQEADSASFEERVESSYRLITDETIFDAQRLQVAAEMLREIITANGIAHIAVRKGKLALEIGDTLQYALFGPETKKIYADFIDRLKVSLKYDPTRSPHDELYELPGMDENQIFYEAQRMAYQVQEKDQTAQTLTPTEQVMLPLEPHPWEVIALHENKTATVKGIETPNASEPVEKTVPMQWLVRADIFETYKNSLARAA